MHPSRSRGRFLRRSAVLATALAVAGVGLAGPALAEPVTPQDMAEGIRQQFENRGADAQGWVQDLQPEARARLQAIQDAGRRGDWAEARRLISELQTDARCAAEEFGLRFGQPGRISYDLDRGVAVATLEVPCDLREPIQVTFVSWVLSFGRLWGTSFQGRHDMTETTNIQQAGTYTFEVALPRPTTDASDVEAALDIAGLGPAEDGGLLDGLLEGIDLDAILAALTPAQIDGLLAFVCPFQVDLVAAPATDVPEILGGDVNPVTGQHGVSYETLLAGGVGQSAEKNAQLNDLADASGVGGVRHAADKALVDLPRPAEEPEVPGDDGGIDIGGLLETLCVDTSPEQVENDPGDGNGDGDGTRVAGLTETSTGGGGTLPRTGAGGATPGLAATGIGMVLAGWLALAVSAFLGMRRRTLPAR